MYSGDLHLPLARAGRILIRNAIWSSPYPCAPLGELHFDVVRIGSITGWIEAVGQDLRYAARGFCKNPVFTLVAVLTLAIGIGGTTTIFSAIDAFLLRPLPYPDQDRLVALSNTYPRFPR